MRINGKDIARHGALQWRVDFGTRDLKNESDWVRGSPLPFFQPNFAGFKEIAVSLMVYGSGREDIKHRISDILAELIAPADLTLDHFAHRFYAVLEKSSIKETSDHARDRYQTLTLQFSGYEYGDKTVQTFAGVSSFEVTNTGNITSPLVLELTPTFGAAQTVITGICRDSENGADLPVTIKNLTTGKTIILDGITGLTTEAGALKAADVDMWALPSVLPGTSTITMGTDKINVTARVLPLFM